MTEKSNQNREWHLFDAKGVVLGRLSTEIVDILRGKKKPSFRNHLDGGDYVVVVNADKVKLTGKKEDQKYYYRHTGYIGNLKVKSLKEMRQEKPEEIIKHSVAGMLPKNKLQDDFLSRLKIYVGAKHPHVNIEFINQK